MYTNIFFIFYACLQWLIKSIEKHGVLFQFEIERTRRVLPRDPFVNYMN